VTYDYEYDDDQPTAEEEEVAAYGEAVREELIRSYGVDPEQFPDATSADLQAALDEQTRVQAEQRARDEAAIAHLGNAVAEGLAGVPLEELRAEERMEAAMQEARETGNWSAYLREKASRAENLDRSGAQQDGRQGPQKFWPKRAS